MPMAIPIDSHRNTQTQICPLLDDDQQSNPVTPELNGKPDKSIATGTVSEQRNIKAVWFTRFKWLKHDFCKICVSSGRANYFFSR